MHWWEYMRRRDGRPGLKQSQVNRVIMMGLGLSQQPLEHPNYEKLSQEAYERNVTVFACINAIMKALSSISWVLMKRVPRGAPKRVMTQPTWTKAYTKHGPRQALVRKALLQTEVEAHPLLTLLERPNKLQGQADYLQQLAGYFLISGNSYEEFIARNTKPALPEEMFVLRPDRMKVLPNTPELRRKYPELANQVDELELLLGYSYTVGSREQVFPLNAILHRKAFHATNDFYGLSPLAAAARAYRTDNLAADWNFALIRNEARPSGTLIAPQTVTDETYERIKNEIKESFTGAGAAGMPLFLEGGLEWTPLGLTPLELDWLAGRKYSRVEICSVFNVPPEMVGDSEHKTYNSFPEARLSFWMEAVLPLADCIRDSYNSVLVPRFGDNLFLDYDRDQIDAIQEDQNKLWLRIGQATHISVNEKRLATGYDMYDGDPETDDPANVPLELLSPSTPGFEDSLDAGDEEGKTLQRAREQKAQRLQAATVLRFKRMMAAHFRQQGRAFQQALRRVLGGA